MIRYLPFEEFNVFGGILLIRIYARHGIQANFERPLGNCCKNRHAVKKTLPSR